MQHLFVEFRDGDECVCDIGEGGEGGGRVAVGESGSWGRRWRWENHWFGRGKSIFILL
jgi:hypothetical protein